MAAWNDDTLGAFGSASNIPTNEWFPVDTTTGQWGTPTPSTPTLATAPGMPDVVPVRLPSTGAASFGMPDQAPLSIGQVAGSAGFAPQLGPQPVMNRLARLDDLGALTPKPSVWEAIARGVGMASPQGRAMLQYSDQQHQQQLTNRLAARRQALAEEQSERAEIRDDFNSLVKLSEIKSKKLRNLYADRLFAGMRERGKEVSADVVEAFKSSGLEEGKQMAKFYEPLLVDLGMDPAEFANIVNNGDIKEIAPMLELAYKLKKQKADEAATTGARQQAQQLLGDGTGTVGDASGVTPPAPATTGAPGPPTAPAPRQTAAAPSKDIADAIDESSRLYPQVRKDLLTSMAASESNFDPKAVSPKGAQGVLQLMPGTAKDMGVEDPFNVQQNVRGGTRYFAQQLTRYKGNEALALAAYNWGPGNVDKVGGDLSKMPESVQAYVKTTLQRASAGGGPPTTTAQRPDTSMMVAGPGAPAPTQGAPTQPANAAVSPQDQAQLTRLDARIAGMDKFIAANVGSRVESVKAMVNDIQQERTRLMQERNQLTEPSRAGARTRVEAEIKADVEERVKGRQTAAEVLGERVTTFYDKATGEQESPGQSMSEMRSRLSEKKVAVLSTDQSKQLSVLKQLEPVLDGYQRLVEYAYGPKGPLKDFSRQPLETVSAMWDQAGQKDPQLQAMRRSLEGQLQSVVRGLGARGDLNAQELDAAKQMLANFDASLGLGISAGAGLGRGGVGPMIGIKPTISVPDTPETGMRVANELVDLVNKRIGSLLGNPTYARTKLLEIPEPPKVNPDDPRYGFGMIPPEVMEAKQQRARQAPQATPQPPAPAAVPPASGQRALKAMTPAQLRQLPDALARAVIANPGMEQGLSPEQMDALADGMERWERSQARR